jgi:2-oxoglutarate dehydrogenase E2 component (dihydrolipoamide succinyltransferase)
MEHMSLDLKVPAVGESITEVEIGDWLKKEGDFVRKDETIAVLETEKATVELPSPESGKLSKILKQKGATAKVGEVIAQIEAGAGGNGTPDSGKKPAAQPTAAAETRAMPAAQRVMAERGIKPEAVKASGPGGRILKEDVLRHAEQSVAKSEPTTASAPSAPPAPTTPSGEPRQEEVVRMTKLRRVVAQRLVEAQQNAALLTTFNEIDMSSVMSLRKESGEAFLKRHGIKLGIMSFFVKASIDALKQFPAINAEIRGEDIVYKNFYDIGVAIGGGKGLVVPVLRNAERLSFAEIEQAIGDFAARAKENKLKIEELQGGTFTISNGGVYGSLLSTPIINPPQSGVLGMHTIQERPVALNGAVVIRPMMYVALTYDHRIVDGREAVTFLKRIKETLENPARMLIEA